MPGTATERTPLASGAPSTRDLCGYQSLKTLFLAGSTITFSVGLINFNNYLMDGRFPYAVPLVLMQMAFCTISAGLLLWAHPALFPSLTDEKQKVPIDDAFIWRGALPIGVLYSTSMIASNLAYEHLSVAFLQMMKEANIVLVYIFSLLAMMEVFSWRHVQVITFAVFACSLTIKGELNFSLEGFLIQLTSGVCECARIVLQSVLLSGKRLDALSYVLVISPICFVLIGIAFTVLLFLPEGVAGPGLSLPSLATLWAWLPILLANCVIAFGLNVNIALLIKNTSATSYIFVGVVKDIVAILVSIFVLHELVSSLQVVSFTLQIGSVIVWSMLKMHPDKFEHGLLAGLGAVLMGKAAAKKDAFEGGGRAASGQFPASPLDRRPDSKLDQSRV